VDPEALYKHLHRRSSDSCLKVSLFAIKACRIATKVSNSVYSTFNHKNDKMAAPGGKFFIQENIKKVAPHHESYGQLWKTKWAFPVRRQDKKKLDGSED
jgi:hypothetical protein